MEAERGAIPEETHCPPENHGDQRSLCQTSHIFPAAFPHSHALILQGRKTMNSQDREGQDRDQSSGTQTPNLGLHLVPSPGCEHAESQTVDDV